MNDTELLTEMLGAVRELAERVERIEATVRENCNAANRILAKRQRDRERIAAQRAEAKNVALQIECRATKEKEAEIRNVPPTPPLKNKGEEKENDNKNKNPRVRACVRRPTLEAVREHARSRNSKVDPEYFYNYYKAKGWPLEDWEASFAIWEWNDYSRSRLPSEEEEKPAVAYGESDWALCRERCANCTGGCCSANVQIPPDKRPDHPIPPEECPHFKTKKAN